MHHRTLLALSLFFIVVAVYMLTYRGVPLSQDGVYMMNGASAVLYEQQDVGYYTNSQGVINGSLSHEPLSIALVMPWVWLGHQLESVGTMAVVWLFNIPLTALTALSIFVIVLRRGYSTGIAWFTALAFALGTIAWFYGRLLFREPIAGFFTLWAFVLAEHLAFNLNKGRVPLGVVGMLALSIALSLLVRASNAPLLLGLFVILLPSFTVLRQHWRRTLVVLGGAVVLIVGVFLIGGQTDFARHYDVLSLLSRDSSYLIESVVGYQVSPARSIWLYSPMLIPALWGAWRLLRMGQWRVVAAPLLGLLLTSIVYGIGNGIEWAGAWGWGPRYLLPLIPVMILWLPPALKWITERRSRVGMALVGASFALGIFVQLAGIAHPMSNYYTDMFRAGKMHDYEDYDPANWHWREALWEPESSPLYYHVDRFDIDTLDIAWRHADPRGVTVALGLLLLGLSTGAGLWALRHETVKRVAVWGLGSGMVLLSAAVIVTGVYSLRDDPRVIQDWPDVRELAGRLNDHVHPDDTLFIERQQYRDIFMNYLKVPAMAVMMRDIPGEDYGSGTEIPADASFTEKVGWYNLRALDRSANNYDGDLWLIASSSPYEPDKRRPAERYLVESYFHVEEINTSQRARAIRFDTTKAPEGKPARITDATFDEMITLAGWDAPAGLTRRQGEVLPVSLMWQVEAPVDFDYNVGMYLVGPEGVVHAQRDGSPQATFGKTSTWQVGETYRDNHGLQIPEELPPGEYTLQVALYNWQTGERLPVVQDGQTSDVVTLAQLNTDDTARATLN